VDDRSQLLPQRTRSLQVLKEGQWLKVKTARKRAEETKTKRSRKFHWQLRILNAGEKLRFSIFW